MPDPDLSRLLAPRSVIVVGATDRPGSYAAQTLLNLRRANYPGPVVGVHPHRAEVFGLRCAADLDAAVALLPAAARAGADAVVIATPADSVERYLDDAGRLGCGGAVVYAAGFGETSSGATRQQQLAATARRHSLPVLGPNANGFVAVGARAPLWGDVVRLPERPGPIALITQSGNLGVLALAHRRALGLHTVVSLGNAAVIDAAAVLGYLAARAGADPLDGPRAVGLYLEDDGDGPRLAAALAACARADLRVAVLKAGRSAAGRAAAGAHTAALAGDHRVFAALIEEAGGVLARDPLDLLETTRALAQARRDRGRLAVMTASGGDAAIAADLAADAGVPLAGLSAATRDRLAGLLPPTATVTNPLDHTNLVWADQDAIAALAQTLSADPDVGPLIYVQDEPPGLPAGDAAEWLATRTGARLGAERQGARPLLVATLPGQEPPDAIGGLRPALAAIAALRRCAPDPGRLDAIAALRLFPFTGNDSDDDSDDDGGDDDGGDDDGGDDGGGRWLAEHEAKPLLAAAGIAVPRSVVIGLTTPDLGPADLDRGDVRAALATAAAELGFPLVLKLSAPGLLHKSELGALALDLADLDRLEAAARRLITLPERPPGAVLLLERQAAPGVELVLAARREGVVPSLAVGLGGIWAEVFDDVVIVPLPADPDRVVAALGRLRAASLLTGGRGRAPADLEAIGQAGHRLGELLRTGGNRLWEVNPLIAGPAGVVAVDALAQVR
jgi:acetyl-CoA synthetase